MTALFKATTLEELVAAHRALEKQMTDFIELPIPLIHPVLFEALAKATGATHESLRKVGDGDPLYVVNGKLGSEYNEEGTGVDGLMRLAETALAPNEVNALFTHRLPLCSTPPAATSPLGIDFVAAHFKKIKSGIERLRKLKELNAPQLIIADTWVPIQECFENIVSTLSGKGSVYPRWVETDARHLANTLRLDRGEGLKDDVALWKWAMAVQHPPNGVEELGVFREQPWGPSSARVLAAMLLNSHTVLVTRDGLLCRADGGEWSPMQWCGPIRPIATDGRFIAFLGAHPRGGWLPTAMMFDAVASTFVDFWPETMPTRFVGGHWGAKSLVIWDREHRQEQLLRHSHGDDYWHHVSSPDGRLVWLVDFPDDGIVNIDDRSVHVDLSRFELDLQVENEDGEHLEAFPRAFTQVPAGPFRLFAQGKFFQDTQCIWSTKEPVDAAGFDLSGQRLATISQDTLRIHTLNADGTVASQKIEHIPLPPLLARDR